MTIHQAISAILHDATISWRHQGDDRFDGENKDFGFSITRDFLSVWRRCKAGGCRLYIGVEKDHALSIIMDKAKVPDVLLEAATASMKAQA